MSYLIRILVVLPMILILAVSSVLAEVPKMINYQGMLTNSTGEPLDTTVYLLFTIYSDSIGSNILWSEAYSSAVITNGFLNVLLGSLNPIPDSVFFHPNRYLGITVGDDSEISPRTMIISTAYSYQSLHSDTAAFVTSSVIDHGGTSGLTDDDHQQYLHVSGFRSMAGDLSLGYNKITNLNPGNDAYDAVTYQQVVKVGDPAGSGLSGNYPNPFIAENAVGTSQIMDNSVTSDDLGNYSVNSDKIVNMAITGEKIALSSVTTNKIQNDAITNEKIAMDAVTSLELSTGAVTTDEIANGTISVSDIGSSARIAAGMVELSGLTSSTSPTTLDEFTINTPAAGMLLITVSGQYYFDLDASTSSSVIEAGYLGLCNTADSDADCGNTWTTRYYQDADNASNTSHTEQFIIQRTFEAMGPGSYTFYLNGQATPSGATLRLWGNPIATAVFVHSILSITSPTAVDKQTKPN